MITYPSHAGKIVFYQDRADKWRWRIVASNGRITADSAQGYEQLIGAKRGFESMCYTAVRLRGNVKWPKKHD